MEIFVIGYNRQSDDYRDRWDDPIIQEEYGYFTDRAAAEAKAAANNAPIRDSYDREVARLRVDNSTVDDRIRAAKAANKILREAGLPATASERYSDSKLPTFEEWKQRTAPSYDSVLVIRMAPTNPRGL